MKTEPTVGHRSFSQFTSWLRCGKAYQLSRVLQAPEDPSWWLVGGKAFHAAAETFLKREFDLTNGKIKDEGIPF
jgi:hypothetical protein